MGYVKDSFKAKADTLNQEIKGILEQHGNKVLEKVTVAQAYQGMRGIPGLITETSLLDSNEGIRFRGFSIPELRERLPKAEDGNEPLPEGLFY
ncbi:MAG: citrate (Si)-synthase, partial [Chitinophagaceae bacterium]